MNSWTDNVKYVIFNEHTLGYIYPDCEWTNKYVYPLHASILRGSTHVTLLSAMEPILISSLDVLRTATLKDFEEYRVSPIGHLIEIKDIKPELS